MTTVLNSSVVTYRGSLVAADLSKINGAKVAAHELYPFLGGSSQALVSIDPIDSGSTPTCHTVPSILLLALIDSLAAITVPRGALPASRHSECPVP